MRKPPVELIKRALEEDGADYDITTLSTVPEQQQARLVSLLAGQGWWLVWLSRLRHSAC